MFAESAEAEAAAATGVASSAPTGGMAPQLNVATALSNPITLLKFMCRAPRKSDSSSR